MVRLGRRQAPARRPWCAIQETPGGPVVVVGGEADHSFAPLLERMLRIAAETSTGDVRVDLSAVTLLDFSCVRALQVGNVTLGTRRQLRVVAASARVRDVLQMLGLAEHFGLDTA